MKRQRVGRCGLFSRMAYVACALALAAGVLAPVSAEAKETYTIYPTPHQVEYGSGALELPETVDVVLESGIDDPTAKRLDEALGLKGVKANKVDAPSNEPGRTEVLVGIKGSGEAVDELAAKEASAPSADHFKNVDAHWVSVEPGDGSAPARIIVLGRDADSAFYGVTTLWQILQQAPSKNVAALTVTDYADVDTRGFIEGYYGNPWSTEDRSELMRWGGYLKQNAYIYAPKDDPKHNAKWRDLYTPEELAKISALAEAGNESKCRFVYALHPFMSNPIGFGSSYEQDLAALKAKYLQVIDAGCRQIMLSADDARDPGSANYLRLLGDLTTWLHELQAMKNEDGSPKYEGLKDVVPFVAANYAQAGESWYDQLPENIRPIMTGTRVWGKADKSTIDAFIAKAGGTKPFMWINWPCTDNTRDHLSMGGYENALGADVTPGTLAGCVINPMQQSEPSKVGIFLNADFSWNNWKSYEHADQVWKDSFTYVDSGKAAETDASRALRTLSEHMKWYQGGGVTFESRESDAVKPMLDAFRSKVEDGSVQPADIDEIEAFFKELQAAASTYAESADNASMREQIDPWIGFWTDGTDAALRYLKALRAHLDGDKDTLIIEYTQGKELFDDALLHSFPYVADTQYARAGTRTVWPVVESLGESLAPIAAEATGTVDVKATVSLKGLGTTGNPANIVDGDVETYAHFSGSNPTTNVNVGDSFTITYEPHQRADSLTFVQSVPAGRPQDVLKDALVEYTVDGETWIELGHVNGDATQTLDFPKTVDLKGVRFTNTQYYSGYWQVNEVSTSLVTAKPHEPFASVEPSQGDVPAIADGNTSTGATFAVPAEGANAGITYIKTTEIGQVRVVQGDAARAGVIEGLVNGAWTKIGSFESQADQTVALGKTVALNGVRLVVEGEGDWTLNEVAPGRVPSKVTPAMNEGMASYESFTLDKIADGDEGSYAHLKNEKDNNIRANDWVGLTFEPAARIGKITFVQDASGGDVIVKGKAEYQAEDGSWHKVGDVTSARTQVFEFDNVNAKAIRITNLENTAKWWKVFELAAEEGFESPAGAIVTDINGLAASGTADGTSATIQGGKIEIPAGSHVAIDLARIQADVKIDEASLQALLDAGLVPVSSINGLSWDGVEGDAAAAARFAGFANKGDKVIEFDLSTNPFKVTYPGVSGEFTFAGTSVEGHGTEAMRDGRLTTYWRPQDASGTLTYNVSDPLSGGQPRNGVHIVSWGEPASAKVEATVYTTPDYAETATVDLGVLDAPVKDLSFPEAAGEQFYGVKTVSVSWADGVVPSIAEIALLDTTFEPPVRPDTFTVTFDDGIEGTEDVVVTVEDGQKVAPIDDPVRDGYTFEGWFVVGPDGDTGEAFDFGKPVTSDVHLRAVWKKVSGGEGGSEGGGDTTQKPDGKPGSGSNEAMPQTGDDMSLMFAVVTALGAVALFSGVMAKRHDMS